MKIHKRSLDPYMTKCGRVIKPGSVPVFKWSAMWSEVDCVMCLKKRKWAVLDSIEAIENETQGKDRA